MTKKQLKNWEKTDGWIYHWHICGLFEAGLDMENHNRPDLKGFDPKYSEEWNTDFLLPWGGETAIRGIPKDSQGMAIEWMPVSAAYRPELLLSDLRERYPDLDKAMGGLDPLTWNRIYYALALIEAPEEMDVTLRFCGWDGCRLWLNGEPAFEEHSYHHVILDLESVPWKLKKGVNALLMKLDRLGCAARIDVGEGTCEQKGIRNLLSAEPPAPNPIATVHQLKRWAMEKETQNPFRGKSPQDLAIWQTEARRFFLEKLGPFPPAPQAGAKLVESETVENGIERRLYHLPSEGDSAVPLFLLLPKEENRNGKYVTFAHGHGKRWRDLAGVEGAPNLKATGTGPDRGDYALGMCRRGFVTSVCCERSFDIRADYRGKNDPCTYAAMLAMAQGYTFPALHMNDIRRMTSFVMSLPELQGVSGPGLTGLSGGGTMTYLLGAFDDIYKACAVWCGMCRYRDYAMGAGCGMQIVPGLWPTLDVGELLSLIAPRPLLLGQGTKDAVFNSITAASLHDDALRAYRATGAEGNLQLHLYPLGHQIDIDAAADFFEANL